MGKLLMPFVNQSGDYCYGFEMGKVWQLAENGKKFKDYIFHTVNTGQLEMIMAYYGYGFIVTKIDETWSEFEGWPNN